MAQRNQTRRKPQERGASQATNIQVQGGNIYSPRINANRFAGAGANAIAQTTRQASQALDTMIKEKAIADTKEGAALAYTDEGLPEGASTETAEAYFSTKGEIEGMGFQAKLVEYESENPNASPEEYAEWAKSQFNALIKDKPDAYSTSFGAQAIRTLQMRLANFKSAKEGEKRANYLHDRMEVFKNQLVQSKTEPDMSKRPAVLRRLISEMNRDLVDGWGFTRDQVGKQVVAAIEAHAMETGDMSLYQSLEMKDESGNRMINSRGLGLMIEQSETRARNYLDSKADEERKALLREWTVNENKMWEVIAKGDKTELDHLLNDPKFKISGKFRANVNNYFMQEVDEILLSQNYDAELDRKIYADSKINEIDAYTKTQMSDLYLSGRIKKDTFITYCQALDEVNRGAGSKSEKFWSQPDNKRELEDKALFLKGYWVNRNPALQDQNQPPAATSNAYFHYQKDLRTWVAMQEGEITGEQVAQKAKELRDHYRSAEVATLLDGPDNTMNDSPVLRKIYYDIEKYAGGDIPEGLLRDFGSQVGIPDMTQAQFDEVLERAHEWHKMRTSQPKPAPIIGDGLVASHDASTPSPKTDTSQEPSTEEPQEEPESTEMGYIEGRFKGGAQYVLYLNERLKETLAPYATPEGKQRVVEKMKSLNPYHAMVKAQEKINEGRLEERQAVYDTVGSLTDQFRSLSDTLDLESRADQEREDFVKYIKEGADALIDTLTKLDSDPYMIERMAKIREEADANNIMSSLQDILSDVSTEDMVREFKNYLDFLDEFSPIRG